MMLSGDAAIEFVRGYLAASATGWVFDGTFVPFLQNIFKTF
jgi:hypothetical protein